MQTKSIETVKDLYEKFGKLYPYAADAVAYYIFGNKSEDNILIRSYKGVYGKGSQINSEELSQIMLDIEYYWFKIMPDLDHVIKNMRTYNGSKLCDYF